MTTLWQYRTMVQWAIWTGLIWKCKLRGKEQLQLNTFIYTVTLIKERKLVFAVSFNVGKMCLVRPAWSCMFYWEANLSFGGFWHFRSRSVPEKQSPALQLDPALPKNICQKKNKKQKQKTWMRGIRLLETKRKCSMSKTAFETTRNFFWKNYWGALSWSKSTDRTEWFGLTLVSIVACLWTCTVSGCR